VKPLNGSARLIKDGKQQTSQVVLLDLLLGIVWLLIFVIFRGRESKEFKVMVMVDIFQYLMLLVGSELLLLVKQSIHNCTWI
jgi:hypothetical protein